MSNPFDMLGEPKKQAFPDYETLDGCALSCQHTGCYEVVTEGKYFASEQLLTWKCSQGHMSKIVEFVL